jgi:hypothetical protein
MRAAMDATSPTAAVYISFRIYISPKRFGLSVPSARGGSVHEPRLVSRRSRGSIDDDRQSLGSVSPM